jgi:hydrogenase-4 membrane subunit HyfE
MSPLLMALLGAMLLPLFLATWRASLFGLACQGFLIAGIAVVMTPDASSYGDWLTLADLVLVRGIGAPLLLYGVLRSQNAPARNDVIPPNLLSWTFAFGIMLAAFDFAELLVKETGDARTLVAVATSGIMLGLLVLATQSGAFSQVVGALRVENAIALFALGSKPKHEPLGVRIGQIVIVALTIALYAWYLKTLNVRVPGAPHAEIEAPTI